MRIAISGRASERASQRDGIGSPLAQPSIEIACIIRRLLQGIESMACLHRCETHGHTSPGICLSSTEVSIEVQMFFFCEMDIADRIHIWPAMALVTAFMADSGRRHIE